MHKSRPSIDHHLYVNDHSTTFLTREQIKARIALGQVLVLHRSFVYKLNSWLEKHPGGQLAILHFVGRDATDEIEAYHPENVIKQMRPFIVGRVTPEEWQDDKTGAGWKPLNPPIQIGLWPMPDQENFQSISNKDHSNIADHENHPKDQKISSTDDNVSPDLLILDHSVGLHRRLITSPSSVQPDVNQILHERLKALEPSPDLPQEALEGGYDLSPIRQKELSNSYRDLHHRIRLAGLYHPPLPFYGYGPDLVRYSFLFIIFFFTSPLFPILKNCLSNFFFNSIEQVPSTQVPSTLRCLVSAIFLGLWWHQITFVAHDAGHSGITGDWMKDRLIGIFVANFLNGISIGWWCDSHDVHHLVTNHPEHDPDIQHLPFFAISTKFFNSLRSTYHNHIMRFDLVGKFLVTHQHRLYYPVLLFARFNLFFNSYLYISKRKQQRLRNLEIVGIVFFWCCFGGLLYLLPSYAIRLMFVLVSFAVTSPLHVQIVLSHFSQSTADLGPNECFAHRQVRTTMDVSCPPWLDFLHGGLHMQVTHHLFPRLPRHQLRLASERFVQPWCRQENLVYSSMSFIKGNLEVVGILEQVANQLKILAVVASAQAKGTGL